MTIRSLLVLFRWEADTPIECLHQKTMKGKHFDHVCGKKATQELILLASSSILGGGTEELL